MSLEPSGKPLFTWARRDTFHGIPYPRSIWIARHADAMPVSDRDLPTPRLTINAAPNPFNPSVLITVAGTSRTSTIAVYDTRGRHVVNLYGTRITSEYWQVMWHGQDAQGQAMPSGTYLLKALASDGESAIRKVTLAR